MAAKNGRARKQPASKDEGKGNTFAAPIEDPRFARLQNDPRFLKPNREEGKVLLDDRFKGLLKEDTKRRERGPKLDRYGRPLKQDRRSQDELRSLYRTEDGEAASGDEDDDGDSDVSSSDVASSGGVPGRAVDYARGEGQLDSSGDEDSESDASESQDDESDDEDADVLIGSAMARHREAKRAGSDDDDSADEDEGHLQVDASDLADLDAQAERAVRREAKQSTGNGQTKKPFAGDTNRLAVVNMDWDHIRAMDLFKVFSSVVSPAGRARPASTVHAERRRQQEGGVMADRPILAVQGRCLNVRVYPSEFGRKRMAREMTEGPPREIFRSDEDAQAALETGDVGGSSSRPSQSKAKKSRKKRGKDSDDEEDESLFEVDEGGDFDEEALRAYQLDRLRYYYAIATFDSAQTARYIVDQIDGSEMEHSANMFDLSFVPDGMTFPDWQAPSDDAANEGWRDEAAESTQGEASYKGVDFMTDALRHSKVKLTWDADDPRRAKVTRRAGQKALTASELRDDDFKAYLASSASEASDDGQSEGDEDEDEDDTTKRERMRALLGLGGDDGPANGFGKAKSAAFADARKVKEGASRDGDMQITFMPGLSEAAERRKKSLNSTGGAEADETTLEKYKRKQKEKRERRKGQGVGAEQGDDEEPMDDQEYDFNDPFFAEDDGEIDFDAALAAEKRGKKSDKSKKTQKQKYADDGDDDDFDEEANRRVLASLVDDADANEAGHFNLKDIVKAEQAADGKAKKGRWQKKKEKRMAAKGIEGKGDNEVQPGFEIDVKDPRFDGLYGDHRFAMDPSHPSFVKTKNMQRLVDERRRHSKSKSRETSGKDGGKKHREQGHDGEGTDSLTNLIDSVKKRAANGVPLRPSSHKKSKRDL